jgi:murein DD-endopeptidase MepM/ murein hydrolase activator NlpD
VPEKLRILAQVTPNLPLWHRHRWLTAGLGIGLSLSVIGAIAVSPDTELIPRATVVETLAVQQTLAEAGHQTFVQETQIRRGDTLASLARRLDISDEAALQALIASPLGQDALRQLRPGRTASAIVRADGGVERLTLPLGSTEQRVVLTGSDQAPRISLETPATTPLVEMRNGRIQSSLFAATDAAGVPDAIANRLVELFGTNIDFHTDLRQGDRFSVVFETLFENGRQVGSGRILAAEFENGGTIHQVFLFRHPDGREDYYTADGRSLKQGFLRSPLEFSRVSSGFSMRRHPIFKTWRQHQGVDFAAPTGTAVKATSDGTVDFVGVRNGYGNFVVLRHREGYATAYGHLNGFARGLRRGQKVDQGQVIGYVGQTGWATGPHLHYEFRVNDQPRDPMTVALPPARPLVGQELALYRKTVTSLLGQLALLNQGTVALAEE